MRSINEVVANNFKVLRKSRKLSLDGVARLSGISKSMLAQIERGEVSPTVATLGKLANGLKVRFSELLNSPESDAEVIRRASREPLLEDEGRFRNYPLFPFAENRPFEMYEAELDPGCRMRNEGHAPGSEEYALVTSGRLVIAARGAELRLETGDAARFRSDGPHSYANAGSELCRVSMVIYYPPGNAAPE